MLRLGLNIQNYRKPLGGFDPDATAFFASVEAAGGTLSPIVKTAWNEFVVREKAATRYAKIKRLYPYLGGVINSARIDAITLNSADTFNFVDGDVDPLIGLTPDGSTKWLRDLSTANTIIDDINKSQLGNFNKGAIVDVGIDKYYLGSINSPDNEWFTVRKPTTNVGIGYIGQNTVSSSASLLTDSSIIVGRYSSTSLYSILNGTPLTEVTTLNSNGINIYRPAYFARSLNGAGGSFFTSQPSNGMFISQFDTLAETQAFESSYKTFINKIQAQTAAQAYFASVEAAGGTLSANVKSEFTSFVTREVENNRWDKIKRLYPYLGGVINSARIDAITLNSATNNNFVNGDADATCGLQGDGSTKYLIESVNMNDLGFDINSFAFGVFTIGASNLGVEEYYGGALNTAANDWVVLRKNSVNAALCHIGTATALSSSAGSPISNSSVIGARFTSTSSFTYVDGISGGEGTVATTTTFPPNPLPIFCRTVNGTPSIYSPTKQGGFFMTVGFSSAETQAFESSYKTFINNIIAYAAAQDYFDAVEAQGGTVTNSQKAAWRAWFLDGVINGWLDSMKAVNFFYGNRVSQASINVVNPGTLDLINQNFLDGDLDGDSIQSDGTTKYFNYGDSPDGIFSNPHTYYMYALCKQPTTHTTYLIGSFSATSSPSSYQLMTPNISSRIRFYGNTLALRNQEVGVLAANSSMAISWENSSLSNLYRDGALVQSVETLDGGALSDQDLLLFAWNNNGLPVAGVNGKWKVAALGENMSTTKHAAFDAASKILITAL